jgi:ABC-type transport system involved in multi-copper enzyme maturation permease subunit
MFDPMCVWTLSPMSGYGWYAQARRAYAGWLLVLIVLVYVYSRQGSEKVILLDLLDPHRLRDLSRTLVHIFLIQHFVLLAAVALALAAGSITEEKSRGTLGYLLTTALRPGDIVLGKWLGQIIQVGTLSLVGLPLLCLFGAFAGLDLADLGVVLGSTVMLLGSVSAAGVLASVWCRKTPTAVLLLYTVAGLGLAVSWWLGWMNSILRTDFRTGEVERLGPRIGLLTVYASSLFTLSCLAVASWRLRPAYLRQLEAKPTLRTLERPGVSDIPLRWKERYVGEVGLFRWLARCPRWLIMSAVTVATLLVSGRILLGQLLAEADGATLGEFITGRSTPTDLVDIWVDLTPRSEPFLWQGIVVAILFGTTVAVRSSGVITGERERQTWDLLLVTPLEPKQIIRGKLWGIIDASRPYLLAYFIPAVLIAALAGIMPLFWIVFWWAATWVLMYFMASVGLACSLRADNSWQSLLATVTSSAWGILLRYLCIGVVFGSLGSMFVANVAGWLLGFPNQVIQDMWIATAVVTSCLFMCFFLLGQTEYVLQDAEKHLGSHDRMQQAQRRGLA